LARGSAVRAARPAFTFLEVLFAVIIVGIGFIMIAAIFPVAISQTQANVSEATGIAVGRDAIRYLQGQLALPIPPGTTGPSLPVTTEIPSSNYPVIVPMQAVPGLNLNQVLTADRRFTWTALYRRDIQKQTVNGAFVQLPAAYAQLYVVVSQNTAEGQVTYGSPPALWDNGTGSPLASNFFYANISGSAVSNPANPTPNSIAINSYATFNAASLNLPVAKYAVGSNYDGNGPVTEGAFVLVVDATANNGPQDAGTVVGWYGQLGVLVAGAVNANGTANTVWYLQTPPPSGYTGRTTGNWNNVYVFILGKAPNPNGPLVVPANVNYPNYDGPAQDVTCTSGFARVNN
jgi:hypothetical protein